jgi:serine/threonine protein kinase
VVTAPDIPGHRVGGVLGSGGFATVYRSWQIAVGREVAVKVDNRVLLSERDQRRFFREVTAAGRLSGHPHVIDVYDAGTLGDGRPYLVMELCPAGSLNDLLRRNGPMHPAQVRDIGIKIADALAAAHQAGVLHRDIKPANILVNQYGVVGLSDFGLASIIDARGDQTASRDALTPAFSAPESFRGEAPTVLADIYALAATLYALLTGRPPAYGADGRVPSLMTIMAMHDKPVGDVPGVPPEFMALLRRGLTPDPAVRPQTAAAFRDALLTLPGPTTAPSTPSIAPVPQAPSAGSPQPRPGLHGSYAMPAINGTQTTNPAASSHTTAGHAPGRPHPHRRPPTRLIALATAALVVIAAAAIFALRLYPHTSTTGAPQNPGATATGAPQSPGATATGAPQSPGATATGSPGHTPAPVGAFGIATVRAGCPAASVPSAPARCPASPECWAGLVEIAGVVTAGPLPCDRPHYWETFAIAIMPADAQTFDEPTLAENPTVRAVCSLKVLLDSRRLDARRIPASSWQIQILPPTEAAYDSGTRTYRCVADITGSQPSTSQFRR